ncbi:hypothetical protein RHO12_01155 [Orbus sturtevantii]|uniref:hypothetical protein n=1 Tax=Orbus sturtevantii TaxID=3074109 RepID=UPI00370D3048
MLNKLNAYEHYFKYRYLLVDNLVALQDESPLSQRSLRNTVGEKNIANVLRSDLSHDPKVCPTLITLAEPAKYLEKAIITDITAQASLECLWPKRYLCAVIITELAPKALAEKLVAIGDKIADSAQLPFYPFFEPFRLELLQQVATLETQNGLSAQLSAIEGYYYPSIHQGLLTPYPVAINDEVIDTNWSRALVDSLTHLKLTQTLVIAWANSRTKPASQQGLPLANGIILQCHHLVEQAITLGLTNSNDILFWGLTSLSVNVDFAKYEEALTLIKQAKHSPGTLSQGFIDTPKSVWDNIILRDKSQ